MRRVQLGAEERQLQRLLESVYVFAGVSDVGVDHVLYGFALQLRHYLQEFRDELGAKILVESEISYNVPSIRGHVLQSFGVVRNESLWRL